MFCHETFVYRSFIFARNTAQHRKTNTAALEVAPGRLGMSVVRGVHSINRCSFVESASSRYIPGAICESHKQQSLQARQI